MTFSKGVQRVAFRLWLVTLGFVAVLPWAVPQRAAADARFEAQADAVVTPAMQAAGFPGLAILVSKNGRVLVSKGYGTADLEWDAPATDDTVFAVGSITKSFTGLAVAQLVAAGKLSLDDTLGKFLPDFPADKRKITVRQLLNHTSGLFNYTETPELHAAAARTFSHEEMFAWFKDKPLAFAPGTQFSYTNSGVYLLGVIVEKVGAKSYGAYVAENILTPFGMTRSSYADFSEIVKKRANGYRRGPVGLVNAPGYSPTVPFSAGAMLSTVGDLNRYAHAIHQSDLVSDAIRTILYRREPLNDGNPSQYALGCWIVRDFEGHRKIAHSGDIYGFSAHLAHYPDDDVTVVVLSNLDGVLLHPSSIEHKLARLALGIAQPKTVNAPLDAGTAAKFVGDFDTTPVRFGSSLLGFLYKDGALHMAFGGTEKPEFALPLVYQDENKFVSAADDETVVLFDAAGGTAQTVAVYFYDGVFRGRRVP